MAQRVWTLSDANFDGETDDYAFVVRTDGADTISWTAELLLGTSGTIAIRVERSMDGVVWGPTDSAPANTLGVGAYEAERPVEGDWERARVDTPEGAQCLLVVSAHLRKDD